MEAPETPADSPLTLEQAMSSSLYQRLMTPQLAPGEAAYQFELPLLDPETHQPSGERIRLALGKSGAGRTRHPAVDVGREPLGHPLPGR